MLGMATPTKPCRPKAISEAPACPIKPIDHARPSAVRQRIKTPATDFTTDLKLCGRFVVTRLGYPTPPKIIRELPGSAGGE